MIHFVEEKNTNESSKTGKENLLILTTYTVCAKQRCFVAATSELREAFPKIYFRRARR